MTSIPKQQTSLPQAFDPERAEDIADLLKETASRKNIPLKDFNAAKAAFGNSPYLAALAKRFPAETVAFLSSKPDASFTNILARLNAPRPADEKDEDFMKFLRNQKNLAALLIALADISGEWPLPTITACLSKFANNCLDLAIARALTIRMKAGDLPWPDGLDASSDISTTINSGHGYFILGLGKLGGSELNYSSDIDIIALYEPQAVTYIGRKSVSDCFIKLTQDVVHYIDQRTMDGYVFRVDLRLRPDPGATPVALSVDAALGYYHSIAANWERSAMIKASFSAGDESCARLYLEEMSDWVWRRNMDFEALKDIAAIKNQINRHYDLEDMDFAGFDVKLGIGGIREIEFYAQVNQLLHAGRNPSLRLKDTVSTLDELCRLGLAPSEACSDLIVAYEYLRTVEHRIQMTRDEQSHSIPEDADGVKRLSVFLGYDTIEQFRKDICRHTDTVRQHYDELLPDTSDEPVAMTGKQIRTALEDAGFSDVDAAFDLIDTWQYGRYRSLKAGRARDLLGQCLPELLNAFSKTHSPDAALTRFDGFLAQLPAGVQLFSLLNSNISLLGLLARIIGLAPALSSILAKTPGLWDAVLSAQFFAPPQDIEILRTDLKTLVSTARDYQDVLDFVRRFAAEQKFRAGVLILEGIASTAEIGQSLSNVCDVILQELIPIIEQDFAEKHGRFQKSDQGITVVALGKYGGQELTHTSDLDIVFLYNSETEGEFSDGKKPLSPTVYYTRLAQHIITAITALTPEGRLFEVDTRLRPSGNQGPLAVAVASFRDYYRSGAWTWEFLALTRARVIHAPKKSGRFIQRAITDAISTIPKTKTLVQDTLDMRGKLRDQFGTQNIWSVKHVRGGLVDIEFICQFLILRHARDCADIIQANTPQCLEGLFNQGFLKEKDFQTMINGYKLQRTVQSLLRLCLETTPDTGENIPSGLMQILIDNTFYQSLEDLEAGLAETQKRCHTAFNAIVS